MKMEWAQRDLDALKSRISRRVRELMPEEPERGALLQSVLTAPGYPNVDEHLRQYFLQARLKAIIDEKSVIQRTMGV